MVQNQQTIVIGSTKSSFIDHYLVTVVQPLWRLQTSFSMFVSGRFRIFLEQNKSHVANWLAPTSVTLARAVLTIPTLLMLSEGISLVPCFVVLLVGFGEGLCGVLAEFLEIEKGKEARSPKTDREPLDDAFEIISTGTPQRIPSYQTSHRKLASRAFLDEKCTMMFLVSIWISLLNHVCTAGFFRWFQYLTLLVLIGLEVANGFIQLRSYFSSVAMPMPEISGFSLSTSAATPEQLAKVKRFLLTIGSTLLLIQSTRIIAFIFMLLAIPSSYELLRRNLEKRIMYVDGTDFKTLDHTLLKFLMQAKAMGSKLIVGFREKKTDMLLSICACACVDEVIADAPEKIDLFFLEQHEIDYVIAATAGDAQVATYETLAAGRYLSIGEDAIVRLVKVKKDTKAE